MSAIEMSGMKGTARLSKCR